MNFLLLAYVALCALLLVRIAEAKAEGLFQKTTPDDECEVQREDAYACAVKYADLNNDERISYWEVTYFRNQVLRWYEKALVWALNETPEKVMDRCGEEPKKTHVTRASFEASTEKCLRHCYDWRLLISMCKRMDEMDEDELQTYRDAYAEWRREQDDY